MGGADESIRGLVRLERAAAASCVRAGSFAYRGQLLDAVGQSYEATILYDLSVLECYIAQLSGDALVIVMGDHQPPFIAAETRSFDTPARARTR